MLRVPRAASVDEELSTASKAHRIFGPCFKDHAQTDIHCKDMNLVRKKQSTVVPQYALIAKAILELGLDARAMTTLQRKFDTANFITKKKLLFVKMKALCRIEERHGADLGEEYKTDHKCAESVGSIVDDMKEHLVKVLSSAKLFSVQMDGTTDAGNLMEDLFLTCPAMMESSM